MSWLIGTMLPTGLLLPNGWIRLLPAAAKWLDTTAACCSRANCEPFQRLNWLKKVCRPEGIDDRMVAGTFTNSLTNSSSPLLSHTGGDIFS